MNTPIEPTPSLNEPALSGGREVEGKWIVIGIFAFGIVATSTLWIYWKLHMMPFMPLQEVLIEHFPNSSPRVEGGQHRMHKGTPMLLRVVMRVSFDPESETEAAETFVDRVSDVLKPHVEPNKWDELHVHLYQETPEDEIRQKTYELSWKQPEQGNLADEKVADDDPAPGSKTKTPKQKSSAN